ncbi:DegV family protein [Brochothrix campestris]|uniref:DegV family protein n=1 Tax=Brochothrix campestris FSL F6-1037 TaxID=1265861 RepID=W7CSZ9_9LIST|nr:DegV family protein [Brochothrix campestris]EUJ40037.1 hypothetical protein BCAMP_06315 [Brochothrix campestris FSL F6-1037]
MKIALVSDTTAALDAATIEKYQIHTVPLMINVGGKSYREQQDLTNKDFYRLMKEAAEIPTSSQPAPGVWLELYKELAQDYDAILVLTLSSEISGTYQTAVAMAAELPEVKIEVVDSCYSSTPQAYLVEEAGRMIAAGAELPAVLAKIDRMIEAMDAYIVADDLHHLAKGGRTSGASALVGSMLKIKPVIRFTNKTLNIFDKIRTQKKALKRIELILADVYAKTPKLHVSVLHADAPEKAQEVYEEMVAKYPEANWDVREFSPVLGTHLGPGAIALVWTIQ